MINLEQVKLLETKVEKTINYVERLVKDNAALYRHETELQARLESYQKRIDELEVLIVRFKEDQSQIENGILSALDRLSQFEKAFEKAMGKSRKNKPAGEPVEEQSADAVTDVSADADMDAAADEMSENSAEADADTSADADGGDGDIADPLGDPGNNDNPPAEGGELDIF